MKEWKKYKLGEILNVKYGKDHKKLDTGSIPVYGSGGLMRFVNSYICDSPSILIPRKGSLNNVMYVEHPFWTVDTMFWTIIDTTIAVPRFVYYAICKIDFESLNVGSAVPSMTVPIIEDIEIFLPSLDEQKRIVKVLLSLESKIELNRQINDNLEQQASSLLSDWISTYPCRTYKLSDIGKYVSDKCDTGDLTSQNYISTENMLPNKKGIVDTSNIPTGKVTCFKVDDILIANIRPYFQKIWKADISGGCSTDVLCIRSCVESHSPILYWILHQDAFFEYVMTGAKGCKMPRGDKQHIMNWSIDLPETQYWPDLATQLGSIDQQIAYNRIESMNLSNLRDTLLPKLISGELKINDLDC